MRGFQTAVVDLCVCVVEFLCAAHKVCISNRLKNTYQALWSPETIVNFENTYLRLEEEIRREAEVNRDLSLIRLGNVIVTQLPPQVSNIAETVGALKTSLDVQRRTSILQWASKNSFLDPHRELRKDRAQDTCDWILRRKEFQDWQASPSPSTLWVHGIRELTPIADRARLRSRIIAHGY